MKQNKKFRFVFSLILIVVVIPLILSGCASRASSQENKNIQCSGNVFVKEVSIASKVAGRIEKILVEEGSQVKLGQELLKLETVELEAKKKQAEGALLAAQSQYEKAVKGARPQEIEVAKANVTQAEAKAQLLENTFKRLENLHKAGAYTTNDLEKAYTELVAAQAQAEQARQAYNMAVEGARKEDVLAAQANVVKAEGALAEINSYLNDATIKAPIEGTVTSVVRHTGELVSTGMPILALTDYGDMWVEASVKDTEVQQLKIGQEAELEFNGITSAGRITVINKNPDFAVRKSTNELGDRDIITYTVKIKVLEPDKFYPGMRVNITFREK